MKASEAVMEFIETPIRLPEGRAVGEPMLLMEWQKDWLRRVFDIPHGSRRAILSVGRRNSKSWLVAALLLAYVVGPLATGNAQVFSPCRGNRHLSSSSPCARWSGCMPIWRSMS
jgi:phage terminase large subunit-like protein